MRRIPSVPISFSRTAACRVVLSRSLFSVAVLAVLALPGLSNAIMDSPDNLETAIVDQDVAAGAHSADSAKCPGSGDQASGQTADRPQKKPKQERRETPAGQEVRITEEIRVVGEAPRDTVLATVTVLETAHIERLKSRDLAEILRFVPGAAVTTGNKNEYTLKLRGFDSRRVALLIDGVPVVDPYYGSFDLKTVSSGGIQSLQITKGASSVLYGPNTMGGIVNVITKRPGPEPALSLTGSMGGSGTRSGGFQAAARRGPFGFSATGLFQSADGFRYKDSTGAALDRANSDYRRTDLGAKVFYNPSGSTELMANVGIYRSAYGMAPDLYGRARYWRFKSWDRTSASAGGFTSLGGGATLRFRTYYIGYDNALEWFRSAAMTDLQSESTFDNENFGGFALADLPAVGRNHLQASLYYQADVVRTQDDIGLPWDTYDQSNVALGVEDRIDFGAGWQVVGGASLDVLNKFTGGSTTRVNPLVGLRFAPLDDLALRASWSSKTKAPNMRALYSPSSGNPDLLSEKANSWELGASWGRSVVVDGAVFFNSLRNLIDSYRMPDGVRRYVNIGEARLNGFELQVRGGLRGIDGSVNYTYLDHYNLMDDRPLDATSRHNLNFEVAAAPLRGLTLSLAGLWASESFWFDTSLGHQISIPAYVSVDGVVAYSIGRFAPFLRVTNLFDAAFHTEPGYPQRGRFFEFGVRVEVSR